MKYLGLLFVGFVLFSCGQKISFTDKVKEEYNLNEQNMKKVQFYTSSTIILTKSQTSGSQGTGSDGTLVSNKSSEQERVIIYPNTKCIFDGFGPNGELNIRFETGVGNFLKFSIRPQQTSGKYYLVADWKQEKGGQLTYGNQTYFADTNSGNAYLMVVLKRLNKTKRKDRRVKGMKV
ncbi:MAG: hypothetical protein HYR91_02830 [Flavobacteriia bacterium]|nr:hypothetical protein [Flavobacteriia bacterium]